VNFSTGERLCAGVSSNPLSTNARVGTLTGACGVGSLTDFGGGNAGRKFEDICREQCAAARDTVLEPSLLTEALGTAQKLCRPNQSSYAVGPQIQLEQSVRL
jgi:hypothetical protein